MAKSVKTNKNRNGETGSAMLIATVMIGVLAATYGLVNGLNSGGIVDMIKGARLTSTRDFVLTKFSQYGSTGATLRASMGPGVPVGVNTELKNCVINGVCDTNDYPVALYSPVYANAATNQLTQISGPGATATVPAGTGVLYDIWGNLCPSSQTSLSLQCPLQAFTTFRASCVNCATPKITVHLLINVITRDNVLAAGTSWLPTLKSESFDLSPSVDVLAEIFPDSSASTTANVAVLLLNAAIPPPNPISVNPIVAQAIAITGRGNAAQVAAILTSLGSITDPNVAAGLANYWANQTWVPPNSTYNQQMAAAIAASGVTNAAYIYAFANSGTILPSATILSIANGLSAAGVTNQYIAAGIVSSISQNSSTIANIPTIVAALNAAGIDGNTNPPFDSQPTPNGIPWRINNIAGAGITDPNYVNAIYDINGWISVGSSTLAQAAINSAGITNPSQIECYFAGVANPGPANATAASNLLSAMQSNGINTLSQCQNFGVCVHPAGAALSNPSTVNMLTTAIISSGAINSCGGSVTYAIMATGTTSQSIANITANAIVAAGTWDLTIATTIGNTITANGITTQAAATAAALAAQGAAVAQPAPTPAPTLTAAQIAAQQAALAAAAAATLNSAGAIVAASNPNIGLVPSCTGSSCALPAF